MSTRNRASHGQTSREVIEAPRSKKSRFRAPHSSDRIIVTSTSEPHTSMGATSSARRLGSHRTPATMIAIEMGTLM